MQLRHLGAWPADAARGVWHHSCCAQESSDHQCVCKGPQELLPAPSHLSRPAGALPVPLKPDARQLCRLRRPGQQGPCTCLQICCCLAQYMCCPAAIVSSSRFEQPCTCCSFRQTLSLYQLRLELVQVTFPSGLNDSRVLQVKTIIKSCLHVQPDKRPTASQVQASLHAIMRDFAWPDDLTQSFNLV